MVVLIFCLPVLKPQRSTTASSNEDDVGVVVDGDTVVDVAVAGKVTVDSAGVDDDWVVTLLIVVEEPCVASTVVESITAVVVAAGRTIIVPIMLG